MAEREQAHWGAAAVRDLPTGTVTFLFTDIEGSTKLLQHLGAGYPELLEAHRALIRAAVQAEGGREFGTEGDAIFVAFSTAPAAVAAAAAAQRALADHPWPEGGDIRVRMGLHTGEATLSDGDYVGIHVHRAARIASAGHGGQILISSTTRALASGSLPEGASVRDLGEHRLKDIAEPEHLYQVMVEGLPADFPPLRTLDARPTNLQPQLTSFVGRDHEVARLKELLEETRLLTLTGPGGTGKTRLSLQVAAELLDRFADGAFFVALSPITDPALVPTTIAEALGMQETSDVPILDVLKQGLAQKELLLVLDNFEQVVRAAPVVSEILAAAPKVRALVTSREVLHVAGEQEFEVPPLALPDPQHLPPLEALSQYDGVRLFIQRAKEVNPSFEVTSENAPAVAEITARLDGLPLAIEIAAARMKVFTPETMLPRLESRLTLLRRQARDLPTRQQTLRNAIDWSHDLLDDAERTVFRRFAVFVRGCTLEAAEEVIGGPEVDVDVIEVLSSLVDKSLVRQQQLGPEGRFQMLMTIREYALERLMKSGEQRELARRHAEHFATLTKDTEHNVTGPDQILWLQRLDREHDNIRAALGFLIDAEDAERALNMAASMWRYWHLRGHLSEGRNWLQATLAVPGADERTAGRARALGALGSLQYWQLDYESAHAHYEEALAISRELGDDRLIGDACYNLIFTTQIGGAHEAAMELAREAAERYRGAGSLVGEASARMLLSFGRAQRGEWSEALEIGEEAVEKAREAGDRFALANAERSVSVYLAELGRFDEALERSRRALTIFRDSADVSGMALEIGSVAAQIAKRGKDPHRAVRLWAAAQAAQDALGGWAPKALRGYEDAVDLIGDALDPQAVQEAIEEGRAMSLDEAIAEVMGESEQS